jgi:hypothetical protein
MTKAIRIKFGKRQEDAVKKRLPIKTARHRQNLAVTPDAMPHTVHCACAEQVFHEQHALSIPLAKLDANHGSHLSIISLRPLPKASPHLSPL